MPIVTKDFTFTQNTERSFIDVPLKGTHPSKVDIYSNDWYLKINFPPYFFELDLKYQIDSDASIAHVGNGVVKFELVKRDHVMWDTAKFETEDGLALRDRRAKAEQEALERIQQEKEEKRNTKIAQEREAVRQQIQVEREKRERVEALKAAEKQEAERSIKAWAEQTLQLERNVIHSKETVADSPKDDINSRVDSAIFQPEDAAGTTKISKSASRMTDTDDLDALVENAEDYSDDDDDIDIEAIRVRVKAQLKIREQPPPRASSQITLSFTSRGLIPTKTARETEDARWRFRIKLSEEFHSQKKKAVAGRAEESNVAFLKDKGLDFFKQKNYQACVYALSDALDLEKDDIECLTYRADSFLHLKDGQACLRDCTTGLSILTKHESQLEDATVPEAQEIIRQGSLFRSKFLFLQGAVHLSLLGDVDKGNVFFDGAMKCDPYNQELQQRIEQVKLRGHEKLMEETSTVA